MLILSLASLLDADPAREDQKPGDPACVDLLHERRHILAKLGAPPRPLRPSVASLPQPSGPRASRRGNETPRAFFSLGLSLPRARFLAGVPPNRPRRRGPCSQSRTTSLGTPVGYARRPSSFAPARSLK